VFLEDGDQANALSLPAALESPGASRHSLAGAGIGVKTVLITGASPGIGRATAILCGAKGWSVGVNYVRDVRAAEDTVRAVQGAGGRATPLAGDVSVEADVIAMFDEAQSRFGLLDRVVINAGVIAPPLPLAEIALERLERIFDVNILGAYLCARECAPAWRATVVATEAR